jgi:UDP-2,3-diacylglucosamine hydrolase
LPLNIQLQENSTYINLGDWITYFTYGEFQDSKLSLKEFKN